MPPSTDGGMAEMLAVNLPMMPLRGDVNASDKSRRHHLNRTHIKKRKKAQK